MRERARWAALVAAVATALTLTGSFIAPGAGADPAPTTGPGGSYVGLPLARVADSRSPSEAPYFGYIDPHGTRAILAKMGDADMPPQDVGGGTLLANVTVTGARTAGWIELSPVNSGRAPASSFNFSAGASESGTVAVSYPGGSGLKIFNGSASRIGVVIDVLGYYVNGANSQGGRFWPTNGDRLEDTRTSHPVPAGGVHTVQVAGKANIPSGASAVLLDLIAVTPAASGYLTSYADGTSPPSTSTLNFSQGRTRSHLSLVALGADGRIAVRNASARPVNLIVDVFGYYAAGAPQSSGATGVVRPTRVVDSRTGLGAPRARVVGGSRVRIHVGGVGGVPGSGVGSVLLNVVSTEASAPGYLVAHADGTPTPHGASLVFGPATIANLVPAPVGADGDVTVDVATQGSTELVVDVVGYTTAATVITGRVTDQSGRPRGVHVAIQGPGTSLLATTTDADGRYQLAGMDTATVQVCFDAPHLLRNYAGSVASGCWQNVPLGQPGSTVTLVDGHTFVADQVLPRGAVITGTVTDDAGNPVPSFDVVVATGSWGISVSTSGTSYSVGGLSSGTYTVCVSAPDGPHVHYVPQCYNGRPNDSSQATSITVTGGGVTGRIDLVLVRQSI